MPFINEWDYPHPICSDIEFPLNIIDVSDETPIDLGGVIEETIRSFSNLVLTYGFIWIDAKQYCGVEYALYKSLSTYQFSTGFRLADAQIGYFSLNSFSQDELRSKILTAHDATRNNELVVYNSNNKIFVIDHAENINDSKIVIGISESLQEIQKEQTRPINLVLVFLNKGHDFNEINWKKIQAESESRHIAIFQGKHLKVSPLSNAQIATIFKNHISCEKKQQIIEKIEQFDEHLKCAYFLDRLLKYIRDDSNPIPQNLKAFSLLSAMYSNLLLDIFNSEHNIDNYLLTCRGRLKSAMEDIPIKQFVFAFGISQMLAEVFDDEHQLVSLYDKVFFEFKKRIDQQIVFENICELLDISLKINYLLSLVSHSIWGAGFAVEILVKQIEKDLIKGDKLRDVFLSACEIYVAPTNACSEFSVCQNGKDSNSCKGCIKPKIFLGLAIGKLLQYIDKADISKGLGTFFNVVEDEYVLPQVDESSGMSVCPITNYEFKKFVDDNGYSTVCMPDTNQARKQYYKLYESLIGKINEAATTDNQRTRRMVSRALKGSDWMHYNRLSNILRGMREKNINGEITALKNTLDEYYKEHIGAPVKWRTDYNVNDDFCNPLQPVVGISMFEAQAYATWLSVKSGHKVRLVQYNPDYLKVVGLNSSNAKLKEIYEKFKDYKSEELLNLINIRENRKCYYGPDNSGDQGPAPVGLLPQFKCSDSILDFLGNIYEMQTTEYTYKGHKLVDYDSIEEWQKLYNCSGGGWQHTRANLPTDYMGQFTALTRNQDIGFRVVVDKEPREYSDIGIVEDRSKEKDNYIRKYGDECFTEFFECIDSCGPISLENYKLVYYKDNNRVLTKSKTFRTVDGHKSVCFFAELELVTCPQQLIMLFSEEYDIFAYYLQKIASAQISTQSQHHSKL